LSPDRTVRPVNTPEHLPAPAAGPQTPSELVDALPVSQLLVMEVLAARARLGENLWTFTDRCRSALRALETAGLVGWKGGVTERTVRAWLTDLGRAGVLSPTYTPRVLADVTTYTFFPPGCEPEDDPEKAEPFAVRAVYRGGGRWAVTHAGRTLSQSGTLDPTPGDDGESAAFLAAHLFSHQDSVAVARALAGRVTVGGHTWASWHGWPDPGNR